MRGNGFSSQKLKTTKLNQLMSQKSIYKRQEDDNQPISAKFTETDPITMLVRNDEPPVYETYQNHSTWSKESSLFHIFSDCGDFEIDMETAGSTPIGAFAAEIEAKYKASITEERLSKLTVHRFFIFGMKSYGRLDLSTIDKSKLVSEVLEEGSYISFQFLREESVIKLYKSFPADFVESQMRITVMFDEDKDNANPVSNSLKQQLKIGEITGVQSELSLYDKNFFEVSKLIVLTDPSYQKPTQESFLPLNIKLPALGGKWKAANVRQNGRTASLICYHTSQNPTPSSWESVGSFGVDSTFFSVFDFDQFVDGEDERDSPGKYTEPPTDENLAFYDHGVLCRAGYGDGQYNCFVSKDGSGNATHVKVEFIE